MPLPPERTRAERDLAFAWDAANRALGERRADQALRWLERCARLAPMEGSVALALASHLLAREPARAAALFGRVAQAHDVAEAWVGLSVAALRLGNPGEAARALGTLLAKHVLSQGAIAIAEPVARAAGYAGWCGVTRDGALMTVALQPGATLRLAVDGRRLNQTGPSALPPGRVLTARVAGGHLLGSPIALFAIRRVEGVVEARGEELTGWAWHPADPDRDPVLTLRDQSRGWHRRVTGQPAGNGPGVLSRPRRFTIPAAVIGDRARVPPFRVTGPEGDDLLGSPLTPGAERARPPAGIARRAGERANGVAVVIPVHGNGPATLACIASVRATVPAGTPIRVVDDGSSEPELVRALNRLAASGAIKLTRHPTPRGYPASANAGIRAARGRDVVLLNSDTLTPPGWLEALREAVRAAADIGTACPLSNEATILSYPARDGGNPMPDARQTARLASLAARANPGETVDIPTGVGFCLYVRRECLDATGPFREDVFAQGYGEENDFCLRAARLGWRHVAVPGAFVAHAGGGSFGPARAHLIARNAAILARLHPDHDGKVAAFQAADPLAPARRRLDLARWPALPTGMRSAILVTHAEGGGVDRAISARLSSLAAEGLRPVHVRPDPEGRAVIGDGFPNLRFDPHTELAAFTGWLRGQRPTRLEIHNLLGHHPVLLRLPALLGVPYRVFVHDYAWFCRRALLVDGDGRYCGDPDVEVCNRCVARHGALSAEEIAPAALRARSADFLRMAERVIAPSEDAARRVRRHVPGLAIMVEPPEPEPSAGSSPRARPGGLVRICIAGAIGVAKGYDVLLAAARDAAERDLSLAFSVVGHTIDDAPLLETGRVFVTGPYAPGEAEELIRAERADLGLLPSVAPETWCFALGELWRAGLDVVAFDLGAQAERIRHTGRGFLLPPGLPAPALNDALLATGRRSGHECRALAQP